MKNKILLFSFLIISFSLLYLNFKKKYDLPLESMFSHLIRTFPTHTESVKKKEGEYYYYSKYKTFLDAQKIESWYNAVREISFVEIQKTQDLSKMELLTHLEFQSIKSKSSLEIFSISQFYFLKFRLQKVSNNEVVYQSGYIDRVDALVLLEAFDKMDNKKIAIPDSFNSLFYVDKGKDIKLSEGAAHTVSTCLHSFRKEKVVYQGNVDPRLAQEYFIGKSVNANITGYFKFLNATKKPIEVHFGKPTEVGIGTRLWVKGSHEIQEGPLSCLHKLREVISNL